MRVSAEDKTTAAPAAPASKPKSKNFRGTLGKVDSAAKTFTVDTKTKGSHTYETTAETRYTKDGKDAILTDGVVGEPVSGSFKEGADGKLVAKKVTFGAKAEAKKEAKQ